MVGFWVSLAVLVVAVVAGIALVIFRGIRLYRRAKRTGAAFGEELGHIEETTASIERHIAAAEAGTGRLREATERLRVSRARLDVQLGAIADARTRARRVFWFVPGL